MSNRAPLSLAVTLALALASAPTTATGQNLKFVSVTRSEMGGPMGAMAAMMPGLGEDVETVTYMKGARARVDQGSVSTINDLPSGMVILIDHDAKTFTRFNWNEMMSSMSVGVDASGRAGAEGTESPFAVDLSVERTGRSEEVNGFQAEQILMVTKMVPTGPSPMQGWMASVVELWVSTETPDYEAIKELQDRMRENMDSGLAGLAGLGGIGEAMSAAARRAADAMGEIRGNAIRSRTRSILVPEGMELDMDAALAADPDAEASGQVVMMTVTSETRSWEEVSLDDAFFEPPAGYTEKPWAMPSRR